MNNFNFKILFLAAVVFNCSILNVSADYYIFNASKNKCLRTSGPGLPLTYGICDDKADWNIGSGYYNYPVEYRSVAYPDYCISAENDIVTLKECDQETTVRLVGNQLFLSLLSETNGNCLASSESNPNEVALKECEVASPEVAEPDQIWFFSYNPQPISVYLYNAAKNKCLRTSGEPQSPVTFGACDNSESIVWDIPFTHEGYYRSKLNPDYCLSIDNGVVSLEECSENTVISRDGNFIKDPLSENNCIGSSERGSKGVSVKECDANDQNQVWYFNNWDPSIVMEVVPEVPETVIVYFYNALKNACLRSDGSSIVFGSCDFTKDDALWEIPTSHDGYYRSKANPEQCLSIAEGAVVVSECDENTTLYRDGNFIKSHLSEDYCFGSSEKDPKSVSLKECNEKDQDQIWYFNNWDPSVVIEEFPTAPETVTVYFYNVFKNGCINSDGTTVTTGNCDFIKETSLWEIPASHDGYYRSKVNAEKCLSVVDGAVTVGDCNENATLYRDGNFIKSHETETSCVVPSKSDDTLVFSENCDASDFNDLWYFNVYDASAVVAAPAEETAVPTEEVATPAEEVAVPTEEATAPAEEVAAPTEEAAVPTEEVAAPTEEAAVPTEEVAAPTEEAAVPTEEVAVPAEEAVVPTEVVEENPTMTITTTVTAVMTEAL